MTTPPISAYDDTAYQLTLARRHTRRRGTTGFDTIVWCLSEHIVFHVAPGLRFDKSRTGFPRRALKASRPARGLRLYSFLKDLAIWRAHNDSGS
jgi:hypothetical protein